MRHLTVALLLVAPQPVAAQSTIDFEGWTDACIADGVCGETTIEQIVPGWRVGMDAECVAGRCLVGNFANERILHPYGGGWAPDPNQLAMSFWVRLDGALIRPGLFHWLELVRTYCTPAPCNVLLELHPGVDGGTDLALQIEDTEDNRLDLFCPLPVELDTEWHHVQAFVKLGDADAPGSCELSWDDLAVPPTPAVFRSSETATAPPTFADLIIGGTANAPTDGIATLDEMCFAPTPAELDCIRDTPPPDRDAGTTPPNPDTAYTFHGTGGCSCHTTATGAADSLLGFLAIGLLAISTVRRRRRTRMHAWLSATGGAGATAWAGRGSLRRGGSRRGRR